MANEIQISAITGLTPTVQLYNGVSAVGSSFAATEIGVTGEYLASMPAGLAFGKYLVVVMSAGNKIGSGEIWWSGSYEFIQELSMLQGLDPNNVMTVNATSRKTGQIELSLTEVGEAVTVQRT